MINATPEQQRRLLLLLDGIPEEQIEDVLESGLLSDLLIANIERVDPEEFRRLLGLGDFGEQRPWYEKALRKVREFLPALDKDFVVDVHPVRITETPGKPFAEYRSTLALAFSHQTDPRMKWTMQIGENDDYIENRLQEIVTAMYRAKKDQ